MRKTKREFIFSCLMNMHGVAYSTYDIMLSTVREIGR